MALTSNCDDEIQAVTIEEVEAISTDSLRILHEIMVAPHVGLALVALQRAGFFDTLIPAIQKSLALHSSKHFKEIWPHTIRVINQTPAKLTLRWAALFHDLGKAQAFSIKDNKVTFHHHEKISSKIFDEFAKKTHIFTRNQRSSIYFLVSNLGYAEGYEREWTDSAVRRFDKEMGIYLNDILALSEADITTGNPSKKAKILSRIAKLKDRIVEIRENDIKQQSILPKGLGTEIAGQLGIPVGPRIGEIRKELENKIEKGELLANENFNYYIEYLKRTGVEITNI